MTELERTPPLRWADADTLAAVRPRVQELLTAAPGFAKLSPDERRDLAEKMVKVCAYMANPDGLATAAAAADAAAASAAPALATAQADGVKLAKERAATDPGFAGEDFVGGASRHGTEQFGELVKKVDFTKFVSGLIQGVFQAIVDSSIQQMRAYGELLANVAKTVDQF